MPARASRIRTVMAQNSPESRTVLGRQPESGGAWHLFRRRAYLLSMGGREDALNRGEGQRGNDSKDRSGAGPPFAREEVTLCAIYRAARECLVLCFFSSYRKLKSTQRPPQEQRCPNLLRSGGSALEARECLISPKMNPPGRR